MLGWRLIRKEDLESLQKRAAALDRANECYRWFSQFTPLDVVWRFITQGHMSVSFVREDFWARAKEFDWKKVRL